MPSVPSEIFPEFSADVNVKMSYVKPSRNALGEIEFVCGRCIDSPVFLDFQSIVLHILMSHHQECSFYCDLCMETFGIPAFAKHVGIHCEFFEKTSPKTLPDAVLSSSPEMSTANCQAQEAKPFDCQVTIKIEEPVNDTEEANSMNKSAVKNSPHECKKCGKQYSTRQKLRNHSKKAHAKKRYKCDVCEKDCKNSTGLKTHYMTHTGEKPYVCVECGKQFSQLPNLKRHEMMHKGEKPFICPHCGRTFAHKAQLKQHEANMHLEDKEFRCDFCKKQFGVKRALHYHIKIHTGEKPYSCSVCGKSFTIHWNLSKHMRVHTGEKPFICTLCGKAYKQSSHLKTHMRTHSSLNSGAISNFK